VYLKFIYKRKKEKMDLKNEIQNEREEIISLRRELHKIPELAFQEFKTSALISEKLKKFNVDTKKNIAGTGIMGIVKGRNEHGKTIMIRADIDALPIQEANKIDYASKHKGVMHACGHDGHIAIALTTAKILSRNMKELNGNVKFLFQPAEEGPGGAMDMIKEGILESPKVNALISLHIWNYIPAGKIGIRPGPLMASINTFRITIKGKSAHGAMPQDGIDAIVASSNVINTLQTVVSREVSPFEPCVLTIGKIAGGTASNIIADKVEMEGTFRTLNQKLNKNFPKNLEKIIRGVTSSTNAGYELGFDFVYPVLVNDSKMTSLVEEAAKDAVGEKNILVPEQSMGGDDVAVILQKVPGCHFFLGSSNQQKGLNSPLHNPNFNFDEDCMLIGVEVFIRAILRFLNQ
jgi:amidohydrolase